MASHRPGTCPIDTYVEGAALCALTTLGVRATIVSRRPQQQRQAPLMGSPLGYGDLTRAALHRWRVADAPGPRVGAAHPGGRPAGLSSSRISHHVAGALDEIPKVGIVAPLTASRTRHRYGQDPVQPAFIPDDDMVEAFATNRSDQPLDVRVGVSCRLHRQRAVRHKPVVLSIPSIRWMAGRSS